MSIKIIDVKTIINKILTETEIYIMIINKLAKIIQFNITNHVFFNNYINDLLYYVQFYVKLFSKKLAAKTLIESNVKHATDFKKEKQSSFRLIYN